MQTVASMAGKLDMTAEQAVEKLKYMLFEVDDIESQIDDDLCDILIDVDDDQSVADQIRDKRLAEIEKKKKQIENLQKASAKARAKKAAAKKKPAKKKAPAKKKKAATKTKAKAKAKAAPTEEKVEATIEKPVDEPEAAPVEAPIVEVEAPKPVEEPVVEVIAPIVEVEPAPEPTPEPEPETAPAAEIVPDPSDVVETTENEGIFDTPTEIIAELLPSKEEAAEAAEAAQAAADAAAENGTANSNQGATFSDITPDPEVVAEVRRKAAERARKKAGPGPSERPARGGAPAGSGGAGGGGRDNKFSSPPVRPGGVQGGRVAPPRQTGLKATGKTARKRQRKAERARSEAFRERDTEMELREFEQGIVGGRKKGRKRHRDDFEPIRELEKVDRIEIDETITVEELSEASHIPVNEIILALMDQNIMATKNQPLSIEVVRVLLAPHDITVDSIIAEESDIIVEEADDPADLEPRATVVTVMGHVDHGKTSLLDYIRRANVASGEAGGITQHIAAYDVMTPQGRVAFLDTPGHEAFTQLRARGAEVTDVVVLVVAADDGVKPQTIEAIDHAKAADVPIIVAINKCDKEGADPERVRQELTQYDLVPEEWGGEIIMKNVSAMTGEGIDDLLEMLALRSELLELKANPNKSARGVVIESELSVGQGPVAWVMVQSGTLRTGDLFIAGTAWGRVRAMQDSRNQPIEEAGPTTPVLVVGFQSLPDAGDQVIAVEDERTARTISAKRSHLQKLKLDTPARPLTLEDIQSQLVTGEIHELNVVIKGDVQGSLEVLRSSFAKVGNQEVQVNVVHAAVGGVNESDVLLASASNAIIIGFHVSSNARVTKMAEKEGVEIRLYQIIYEATEDLRKALEGMLAPDEKEVVTGHVEIRAIFRSSKAGTIAGCYVLDGEVSRGCQARLLRDDIVIADTKVGTLRREKDDAKTVSAGYECGIKLDNYEDIKEGDVIETYKIEAVAKKLE